MARKTDRLVHERRHGAGASGLVKETGKDPTRRNLSKDKGFARNLSSQYALQGRLHELGGHGAGGADLGPATGTPGAPKGALDNFKAVKAGQRRSHRKARLKAIPEKTKEAAVAAAKKAPMAAVDAAGVANRAAAKVGSEAAGGDSAGKDPANQAVDKVASAASPDSVVHGTKAAWNALPSVRADKTLKRAEAKSRLTLERSTKKLDKASEALDRAAALERDGLGPNSRKTKRQLKRAEKDLSKGRRLRLKSAAQLGQGKGVRAGFNRFRLRRAQLRKRVFRWVAVGAAVAIVGFFVVTGVMSVVSSVGMSVVSSEESSDVQLGDVELEVIALLKSYGYSDVQVAAICGNIYAESRWDPDARQDGGSGLVVDGQTGYGLYQITWEGTQQAFRDWCLKKGRLPSDPSAQTEFFCGKEQAGDVSSFRWDTSYHDRGTYATDAPQFDGAAKTNASHSAWKALPDEEGQVDKATYLYMACVEQPAGGGSAHFETRCSAAHEAYSYLKSGGAQATGKAADVIALARGEVGSTNGTKYYSEQGSGYAGAWCACFTRWALVKCGVPVGKAQWVTKGLSDEIRSHGGKAISLGNLSKDLRPGDVVIVWTIDRGGKYWKYGHTGIVSKVSGSTFTMIAGNTDLGDGVSAVREYSSPLSKITYATRPNYADGS